MSNSVMLDINTKTRLNYDMWPKYSLSIASNPPKGKSRAIMLLHAYVPFWNAGSEVCAHTVNRKLVQEGHEVWVGAPGYPNRIYEGVHLFDMNDRYLLHELMVYTNVISTHSFRDKCIKLSNQYGATFIDWFHGGTYTSNVQKSNEKFDNKLHCAVFNSESLKLSFSEKINKTIEDKITILRPPVDWREYEIHPSKYHPKYITLSNLNENKGGHILIEIAKNLPEYNFLGVRGSYWKQIEDVTVQNITYIDNTPHIKDVYSVTKILIMPSLLETWGRTAVEAMSSGIPVVCSPTPGLRECCQDAVLFVDRDNIKEWVRIIKRLMSDKLFYEEYSNRGKVRAKQLEPTHDLEVFQEWYDKIVIPSLDRSVANKPWFLEKYLDPI